MVDLASCYFCGSVEGLKEYPVIPQDLYPPDDVQRTIVVCPSCREKLGAVLEPIFDYFDSPNSTPTDSTPTEQAAGANQAATPQQTANQSSPQPRHAAGDTDSNPPAENRATQAENRVSDNGSSEESSSEPPQILEDGLGTNERTYTESRGAGYRWEPGEDRQQSSNELPDGAKQVARLLQNREFPVDREAIVELAEGAYDLSRKTSNEALDALIERGYISESDGSLHNP